MSIAAFGHFKKNSSRNVIQNLEVAMVPISSSKSVSDTNLQHETATKDDVSTEGEPKPKKGSFLRLGQGSDATVTVGYFIYAENLMNLL